MQREVEHVLEVALGRLVAEAGPLGGVHGELLGDQVEHRLEREQTAGAVEPHQRWPVAARVHLGLDPPPGRHRA